LPVFKTFSENWADSDENDEKKSQSHWPVIQ